MKNLKIFTFGFLLIGLYLTSCKKDVDQQLQQSTPAENKENLFEKSLTVYSADKTSSTILCFRAASKELLDKMSLEDMEFTLDKAPELSSDASDLAAPATTEDAGFSNYSKGGALLPQSLTERMQIPTDAIQVELPSLPKIAA